MASIMSNNREEGLNKIILSICIPTYNRCELLDRTLFSIVSQDGFDNRTEIIISDDCSTDDTQKVSFKYAQKYSNVIYHRNLKNEKDQNFVTVLGLGKGKYLKLLNDYSSFLPGSLLEMVRFIERYNKEQSVLYFSNGTVKKDESIIVCDNFDSFVESVSSWATWIGTFGIWKSDFDSIPDVGRFATKQLLQTDVLFRSIKMHANQKIIIYNVSLIKILIGEKKIIGYNSFDVLINNYFFLFDEYIKSGEISKQTFLKEKKKIFWDHVVSNFISLYITKDHCAPVSMTQAVEIIFKSYKNTSYFYISVFYVCLYKLLSIMRLLKLAINIKNKIKKR